MFEFGTPLPWVIALAAISLMYSYGWHVELRTHKWGPFLRRHPWLYVLGLFVFMAASSYFFADVTGLMLVLTQGALWGLPALGFKLKELAEAYGREFQKQRREKALARVAAVIEQIVQGSFWPGAAKKARKPGRGEDYENAASLQARALARAVQLQFRISVRDQYADPDVFWCDMEDLLEEFVSICFLWQHQKQDETNYPKQWRKRR